MKVSLTNTLKYFDDLIKDLGGNINALTPEELLVYKQLTNKKNPMTYRGFVRLKRMVYKAVQNKGGLFADLDSKTVNDLYNVLKNDQLVVVEREAGGEILNKLKSANRLTVKYKALEDRIINAFGKDGEGSIANLLRTTLTTGGKGDITKLNKIIKIIPEDLRKESLLTALNSLSRDARGPSILATPFSFSKFSDTFERLKKQSVIYNILKKEIGDDAIKVLENLSNISNRITTARANVLTTGKALQALQTPLAQGMIAENILEKVMTGKITKQAIKSGGVALGAGVGGPPGAVAANTLTDFIKFAKKDKLKIIGELFENPNFLTLIDEFTQTGNISKNTINKINNTPAFKRWAKTMGIDDGRNWLQGAIVTTAETPPPETEANQALDEIIEEQSSLDQSPSALGILDSISGQTADKIRQYV